jgi:hypothetical protein
MYPNWHRQWSKFTDRFLADSPVYLVWIYYFIININQQVQSKFNRDMYGHYVYTPRELTHWCLSLLRYNLNDLKDSNSVDGLLEIWAYEACRLFQDRLVDDQAKQVFDTILSNTLQEDWRTNISSKIKGFENTGLVKKKFVKRFISVFRTNLYYIGKWCGCSYSEITIIWQTTSSY